jgi:hypothetical protein
MTSVLVSVMLSLAASAIGPAPAPANWCEVGQVVMIPDGREGPVTAVSGDLCRVLVYGQKHASLWPHYLIEPAHPVYGR